MSKPVLNVIITTSERGQSRVKAVIDSGSFYTIVREDVLPKGTAFSRYPTPRELRMAGKGGKLRMVGSLVVEVAISGKDIRTPAYVSPDLSRDMLIGAETMQAWDISMVNRNGTTRVVVARDMNDPEITEVDLVAAWRGCDASSCPSTRRLPHRR